LIANGLVGFLSGNIALMEEGKELEEEEVKACTCF
jgi:hypothetical protein